MQNFLKYGDKVIVKSNYEYKGKKNWGLLSAEGFFTEKLTFEQLTKDCNSTRNIRNNVFELVPVLNYEFHTEFLRILKFYEQIKRIDDNNLTSENVQKPNLRKVLEDLKLKLTKLQKQMDSEKELNEKQILKSKGKFIRYEDQFQLMHFSSRYFVTSKNICSNTSAIGYIIEMSKIFSKDMILKIKPRFKSFQNGDFIQYNDEVKIQSQSTQFYLAINFNEKIQDFSDFNMEADKRLVNLAQISFANKQIKYGMFFNHTSKNGWCFLHFPEQQNLKLSITTFQWYDFVQISHFESGSVLQIKNNFDESQQLIIKEQNNESKQQNFLDYLWQFDIVQEDLEKIIDNDLNKIQNIVLRNVFTNKIIAIDENCRIQILNQNQIGLQVVNCKINCETTNLENPLLASISQQKITVPNKEQEYTIEANKNYFLFFTTQEEENKRNYIQVRKNNQEQEKQDEGQNSSESEDESSINETSREYDDIDKNYEKVIQICEYVTDESVFSFQKISNQEKEWVLFSQSLVKVLNSFLAQRSFENHLQKVNTHLIEVIMFIFDEEKLYKLYFPQIESYKGLIPNYKKQVILREIKFFELLIKILDKLNTDQMILKKKKTFLGQEQSVQNNFLQSKLQDCQKNVYFCLLYMIKDNIKNQGYLSKWVDEFINQFLDSNSNKIINGFNYENLIKKIFKNDHQLIKKKLTSNKINSKLQKIQSISRRFKKMLQVLKFLYVVFGKNKIDLNKCVYQLLFVENRQMFLLVKKDQGTRSYYIESCITSEINDQKVYIKNYNHLFEQEYNFIEFFEVIVMYAKMGDKKVIRKLQNIYDQHCDIFIRLVKREKLNSKFRIIFLKMILYIWLTFLPNEDVRYSFRTKNFLKIKELRIANFFQDVQVANQYKDLLQCINETTSFQNLKIIEIDKQGEKKMQDYPEMTFKIICSLLNYGILRSLEDIKQILKLVFKFIMQHHLVSTSLLNFINDYFSFNYNYTLNLVLKDLQNQKFNPQKCETQFFYINQIKKRRFTNDEEFDKYINVLIDYTFTNETKIFEYINKNFINILISYFSMNVNKKNTFEQKQKTLLALNNIFTYRKNFFKFIKKINYLDEQQQENYQVVKNLKDNIIETNKNRKSVEQNKKQYANIFDQIIINFFQDKKIFDIFQFYDGQLYKNIYDNFQLREKNIYLYLLLKKTKVNKDLQNLVKPLEIIDVIIEAIEVNELHKTINQDIFQQAMWIIFILCKDHQVNSLYFWKKYKNNFFKYLSTPKISLFVLLSEIAKNNQKLQTNIDEVQEILENLFSQKMSLYHQKPNNIVASFFLLETIKNLISQNNKIVFKNQFMILPYLKVLSSLNNNIQSFLTHPNNIKWEFHEITQKNDKIIFLNPEINIYCKTLDVLSLLAKGSYNASDNIVRNMFTLKNLMEVLCNEYPISLKISVLNFFINSYFYVDKSKIFPIINEIIFCLDEKFFRQITKVIDQNSKPSPLDNNYLYSNDYHGMFQDYSSHYISLNLSFFIILLIKIHRKYSQFRKLIQLKISEPLKRYVLNKLDESNFNKDEITKKVKILRMLVPLEIQSNSSTKLDQLIENRNKFFNQGQANEYQTEILDVVDQIQQFVFLDVSKDKNKKRCSIQVEQPKNQLKKDSVENISLKNFKDFFTYINQYNGQSHYVQSYKDVIGEIHKEEFKQLYKSVFHSPDSQEEIKEFFQALNIYLRENIGKINKKEKLFCIDLITYYIKSINPQDIPLYEWTEDTIQSFDTNKGFLMKQNYLGSNGTIETILFYLENESNHAVLIEILNLSNLMLLGGNLDIQNLFYYQIKENQSTQFLKKINQLITDLFKEILISTKIQNKLEKRKLEQKASIISSDVDLAGEIFDEERLYHKQIEVARIKSYIILLKNIYKFLQLLTEGQYYNFQNYLTGVQQENQNINIIATTATYFKEYLEFNFVDDLELRNYVLEFLIEIIQGPHIENQQMIFTYKIVDMCKSYIYELGLNEKIYELQYNNLLNNKYNKSIKKIIRLFYSMLENNLQEKNIESMKNNMDQFFFKEKLKRELLDYFERINLVYKGQNDFEEQFKSLKIHFFDEEIRDTFDYFFLSRKLGIELEPDENEPFDYLQFYQTFSGKVEIKLGTELKTVYFILHPICKYLNEKMKQEILSSIESKDKNERMTFFFDQMTTIFLKVQNEARLSRSKILYILKAFKIRECFVIFSVMLNAFIFFFMSSEIKQNVLIPEQFNFNYGTTIMKIIVMLLMNICILRLVLFIWLNFKITFYGYWRNQLIKYSTLINKNQLNKQEIRILEKFNETNLSDEEIKDILKLYIKQVSEQKINSLYVSFYFYFYGIYQFIINTKFLIYLSYILFCIFGYYYQQFFFYSFLLIEISLENPSMNTVFLSISLNKKQFVLLIIFLFCIVIIFANFAYYFASDTFWNDLIDSGKGENVCTSIWQCVITIFSLGPRSSGSVGDVIERQSYVLENRQRFYFRYFFDLLCFIVINVIFMNILFGIIIDTFKVLRSRNNEIQQEKDNLCYVCYLTRTEFEKEQQDFEHHIKEVHNLWQYIFFVYYLYNKYQTDYSGIEAKVRRKLDTKDINWIPYLATQKISFEQKVSVINQIKHIKSHLTTIKQKLDNNQSFQVQKFSDGLNQIKNIQYKCKVDFLNRLPKRYLVLDFFK